MHSGVNEVYAVGILLSILVSSMIVRLHKFCVQICICMYEVHMNVFARLNRVRVIAILMSLFTI